MRVVIGLTSTRCYRTCDYTKKSFFTFLQQHLPWLLASCDQLMVTRGTATAIQEYFADDAETSALFDLKMRIVAPGSVGMVHLTFELIEGRLAACFHFAHSKEESEGPMKVLKRQALVHNVVYADDTQTADAIVQYWKSSSMRQLRLNTTAKRRNLVDVESLKGKKVIALIAHNGKKLALCSLAIKYLDVLLNQFDFIIATGTTGGWISKFLQNALPHVDQNRVAVQPIAERIICCESGPLGGDVQIAHVVLSGSCSQVVFLIDPMESHPHEPDISFFEQVLEANGQEVRLVRNENTAEVYFQLLRAGHSGSGH